MYCSNKVGRSDLVKHIELGPDVVDKLIVDLMALCNISGGSCHLLVLDVPIDAFLVEGVLAILGREGFHCGNVALLVSCPRVET